MKITTAVKDMIATENAVAEAEKEEKGPWALDTQLIIPIQETQVLIYESAVILAARTFLKIANLPYIIVERSNAADISPTGKLPVLRCGGILVSEMDGIIRLAEAKGVTLTGQLTAVQKADIQALMSMVHNKLGLVLLYLSWMDNQVYKNFTNPRVASPFTFPLSFLIPWTMRKKVIQQLKLLHWGSCNESEIYRDAEACLVALDERLGESKYFMGESPTELDALVFGYLYTIMTTVIPASTLKNMVLQQRRLKHYCWHMEKEYFP